MYAVAVAAAVYPDAIYGSDQWDEFNSMLPAPVVDPSTAGKISEAWVHHHQMSWDACISRLYGCDPRELIESPDDRPSSEQSATEVNRVHASTMKTDAGRQIADRVNRHRETSETQLHRLTQVLNEYPFYTRNFQLNLADAAIVWAMAALASHERRDECKSNLHAISDIMYASTEDAERTLSESERQQVVIAATAVHEHLTPEVGDVLRASVRILATFEKDNNLRMAAEILHQTRGTYLEHAPSHFLPHLIGHCFIMCGAIDAIDFGVGSHADLEESIENVVKSSSEASRAVLALVKTGALVVQDGIIMNPQLDAAGE